MFFLLQAQPAPTGPLGGMSSLLFMGLIMVVFYMFFIRPQQKKQKQQKLFIEDLKRGDRVVTISGIHGKINRMNDDGTIELEISPGSYVKMEKSAISMEMTAQVNKAAGGVTAMEKK